jgi:hypothetical protein
MGNSRIGKRVIRNRTDISQVLRRALSPGGDKGIGQMVNHTCCEVHCNAEFRLTRAISGDPRTDSTDENGTIVLAVRACRDIKQHEAILVHYNPGAGIETWKDVFKCGCCQCSDLQDYYLQCAMRRMIERQRDEGG